MAINRAMTEPLKDINAAREDFPALWKRVGDKPFAYLDTASSAQKPHQVIGAMKDAMEGDYANIHRGLYHNSQKTTEAFEAVRGKVAGFVGASQAEEIIFTRNTTEAINLVAHGWGREHLKEGDEIILTEMEHHANIVPWQLLQRDIAFTIKTIPVTDKGELDLDQLPSLFSEKTKLVAFTHISNALGTINPVQKIIRLVKTYNNDIITLIDGSQSVVHAQVDVKELGCDFFAFTGHKIYGPTGAGVLYGRTEILDAMRPYQGGGDMIDTVSFDGTTYKDAPARFEAGTPAFIEVIGMGAAIDYLDEIGMDNVAAHEKDLLDMAMRELSAIDGLTFYGTGQDKAGIISFTADWAHPSDIAMILDKQGVAVRTGHHCCMPLMARFGIEGTVRASFGLYSSGDDILALINGLQKAKELLA